MSVSMIRHALADTRAAVAEAEDESMPDVTSWPEPLDEAAYHGVAGDIVRAIEPHTEADPAAVLVQLLAAAGSIAGRGPHAMAEADRQGCNIYAAIVGVTSRGRKGTSWGHVQRIMRDVDQTWADGRIVSGLSSGEGLIWAVRDPILNHQAIKERGRVVGYEDVEDDPGVADKRLMVVEGELAGALRVLAREGNTLSALARNAFDHGTLQSLTKNSPAVAHGAHISIVGHVTKDELLRYLGDVEAANGFANRFVYICARRSKVLPEGGRIADVDFAPLVARMRRAMTFAAAAGEIRRDDEARAAWRRVYPDLSDARPGLLGAVTARAEAIVTRLSVVYAVLDESHQVRLPHLRAALAVWQYAEASARYIFGDSLGDPVADTILRGLRGADAGMSRTEISVLFDGHRPTKDIARALGGLQDRALAHAVEEEGTGGRPVQRWYAGGR